MIKLRMRNNNLNLMNIISLNKAMHIIAFFILSYNFIYAQISEIENKCFWVTRENMVDENSIKSALLFAHEAKFNIVFLQIRGRGDAFYNSNIINKNSRVSNNFDPLDYAVKLGHALGLKIHVWMNCYILWSSNLYPKDSSHILYSHPLWMESDIYGKSDSRIDLGSIQSPSWEGLFISPMHQEVNQYLREVVKEVYENYDIDGLHLDYIRYQDEYYGFHPDGRKEFSLLYDIDPLDIARGIISTRYGWEQTYVDSIHLQWKKFKQNKVTELLEYINEDIESLNKKLVLSAAVKPNLIEAQTRWHQNWKDWIDRDLLDFVVPMNYSKEVIDFMTNIKIIKSNINKNDIDRVIMGIAVYNQDSDAVIDKIFLSRLNGIKGVSLFSYDYHKDNPEWFKPIIKSMLE